MIGNAVSRAAMGGASISQVAYVELILLTVNGCEPTLQFIVDWSICEYKFINGVCCVSRMAFFLVHSTCSEQYEICLKLIL